MVPVYIDEVLHVFKRLMALLCIVEIVHVYSISLFAVMAAILCIIKIVSVLVVHA